MPLKEVSGTQMNTNPPEDVKAGVNLLHGVKVYAQKRGRQQVSENGSAVTAAAVAKKKGRTDVEVVGNQGAVVTNGENVMQGTVGANGASGSGGVHVQAAQTQAMDVDQRVPTEEKKPKRKRQVRKLAVTIPQKDVWERLKQIDAGLSMADWIALSRHSAKDVQDGIRYLHGRRSKGSEGAPTPRQSQLPGVPVN